MLRVLYVVLLCCGATRQALCQRGLDGAAVPSIAILGAAKGGTTDLYGMIRHLHSGVPPKSNKEENFDIVPTPFTAPRVRCVLYCPRKDKDKTQCRNLTNVKTTQTCSLWLNQTGFAGYSEEYPFTIAGNPSQYFLFHSHISKFNALRRETGANTLFVLILRDPVTAISSLFNHWAIDRSMHVNSTIVLEEQLTREFAHLEQPEHWAKVKKISELVTQGSTDYGRIVSLFSSFPRRTIMNDFIFRHTYIVCIIAYISKVEHIEGNFLIARSETVLPDRFSFFYNVLFPFMHPNGTTPLTPYSVMSRHDAEANPKAPSNQKKKSLNASAISPNMTMKLRNYFSMFPLEPHLYYLQKNKFATVFPPLESASVEESSWKWP